MRVTTTVCDDVHEEHEEGGGMIAYLFAFWGVCVDNEENQACPVRPSPQRGDGGCTIPTYVLLFFSSISTQRWIFFDRRAGETTIICSLSP